MNIQEQFIKLIYLLENNSNKYQLDACIKNMRNSEVLFYALKLERAQFLEVYTHRMKGAALAGRKTWERQLAEIINSYSKTEEQYIYFNKVYTKDENISFFTNFKYSNLYGIFVGSANLATAKAREELAYTRGVPPSLYLFINGKLK